MSITRLVLIGILTVNVFEEAQMPRNMNSTNSSELTYFLRSISVLGQAMENIALIIGVVKFHFYIRYSKTFEKIDLENMFSCKKTIERYEEYCTQSDIPCINECPLCFAFLNILFTVIAAILLNFIASILPLALLLRWTPELFEYKLINLARPYAYFSSISFVANFAARLAMIIATLAVGNAWMPLLEGKNLQQLMNEYKNLGRLVASVQKVFQEWFVIKWIVYFTDITVDSIIAIRALFGSDIQNERDTVIYIIVHLSYNFVAFMTLYVCGGLMNSYHDKYCKKVEKKIRSNCEGSPWDKQCALSKLRKRKYKFIPSLCGFSIPLDSSGYTLSLLLALVAFIANFVSTLY